MTTIRYRDTRTIAQLTRARLEASGSARHQARVFHHNVMAHLRFGLRAGGAVLATPHLVQRLSLRFLAARAKPRP